MVVKVEIKLLSQDELERIRRQSSQQGDIVNNPMWKRAYYRLADAADYLRLLNEPLYRDTEEKSNLKVTDDLFNK